MEKKKIKRLRDLIKSQHFEDAYNRLITLVHKTSDYTDFITLCRIHRKLSANEKTRDYTRTIKIALVGGASTELLEKPLRLAIESIGMGCEIYGSEFNTQAEELLNPDSQTVKFSPQVVIMVNTPANIISWPNPGDSLTRVTDRIAEVCDYYLGLWSTIHNLTRCDIIFDNFFPADTRPPGNLGAKMPWDKTNFIRRLNLALGDCAPDYVHINDVAELSSKLGVQHWFDPRFWFHAKQPVSFACLIPYIKNTARIIGTLFGYTSKCLVLDLDNTLWGGVIGDDGVDGIAIGQGDALGEAFLNFQEYIITLKNRGVLLAVCSKNEEDNALMPFQDRKEMVLKREDFVAFKANWNPKPDNIIDIAKELNIGLDSFVFVDDNPVEREYVRKRLPEVKVLDLTDDPAFYSRILDNSGWFEITSISQEDKTRTVQYHENARRKRLKGTAGDYSAYLEELQQRAVIRPFEKKYIDRITQLINKSNQFNLTTSRKSRSEVEHSLNNPELVTRYVRMADRFGDNGLISVFNAHKVEEELHIDQWLMSCRVLKRGVEQLLLNSVVKDAKKIGITKLIGVYIPTKKNKLVQKHYESLGFTFEKQGDDGSTHWSLDLKKYKPYDVKIKTLEDF